MKQTGRGQKRKEWIGKLIVGFVCIMIFFTIFSRVVHNATTATVTLTSPASGKISHTVSGSAVRQSTVVLPEGILLEQYYCTEEQHVEAGDQLLQLNLTSLQKKMDEYTDEIKKLKLQNQELRAQQKQQEKEGTVMPSTQIQQNNISVAQYEKKCAELEALKETEGIVSAETSGTVTSLRVEAGELTTESAVLMLMDDTQELKSYENCIDKAALHQNGDDDYYVYVVEESDTILGKQKIARREKVELLDSDDETAAVDGIFSGQQVVLETSRELNDNNPVRVQE